MCRSGSCATWMCDRSTLYVRCLEGEVDGAVSRLDAFALRGVNRRDHDVGLGVDAALTQAHASHVQVLGPKINHDYNNNTALKNVPDESNSLYRCRVETCVHG